MQIKRDSTGVKIKLPKYKIHIKTINNKIKKGYQYTCILPSFLCSFFNVTAATKEANTLFEEETNTLIFYTIEDSIYLLDYKTLLDVRRIRSKENDYEKLKLMLNTAEDVPEEVEETIEEIPTINYNLYNNMDNIIHTTPFIVGNNKTFRFTLATKFFEDFIDIDKDNYIQYTVDTTEKDVLNRCGVVRVDILQE